MGKGVSGIEAKMDSKKTDIVPDEALKRSKWGKPIEFVLSCLGYAVGLGNVWRFPYLCYRNGGGVFVLVYLIMCLVMGIPIFYLELVIGQYSGLGPEKVFGTIAPLLNGIGYCTLVVITLVTIYYMVIIAWILFYFFASFAKELPFGSCSNAFNTVGCYSVEEDLKCDSTTTYYNFTCTSVDEICKHYNFSGMLNKTYCDSDKGPIHLSHVISNRNLASYEYFNNYVLGKSDATWDDFGGIRWELVLCLLLAWIIAYICVAKGVQSFGKAVYFTALFPYVLLTALVILGATLDGASEGIRLYLTPKWEMLADANVWGNAASQTFYSFGIGCGSLITFASYSEFDNNCLKDVVLVSVANVFTSIYAGFAIFAMLGFLAVQLDIPVEDVATDGPGLAFVAYPEALNKLPIPTLWALLFFFMLFILGLGSQFGGIAAVNAALVDKWPQLRRHQTILSLGICFVCFLLALPMCFDGGVYIFTLLEWNTASWAILLIGFAEVVVVSWAYGCNRILDNIAEMKMKLASWSRAYWWICWVVITPATLIGVFIFQMATFALATYEDYIFPAWADSLGIMIGLSTLLPLPIFAFYSLYQRKYVGWQWLRPTGEWGPQKATLSIENLVGSA